MNDLKFAFRQLLKNPGFTTVAVLTLALGIGANTTIFSFVRGVLLRPLPYRDADRLVMLWERNPQLGFDEEQVGPASVAEWKAQNRVFEEIGFIANDSPGTRNFLLDIHGEAQRTRGRFVSADFFRVLGVEPLLGRAFDTTEDERSFACAAVLSYAFWQNHFAGDPSVLGRKLKVDRVRGGAATVIGVMPPRFRFPQDTDLWMSLSGHPFYHPQRHVHDLWVVARLKEGVRLKEARVEMNALQARFRQAHPEAVHLGSHVKMVPLLDQLIGPHTRVALLTLLGAVAFVLFIACANVANLLLTRATARQREIAIRVALGASRAQVLRQLLVESSVLAVLGAAAGIALTWVGLEALPALEAARTGGVKEFRIGRFGDVSIDGVVLSYTVLITVCATLLFGMLPALQALKVDVIAAIKEQGHGIGIALKNRRVRSFLLVSEIALSLILLTGAALMLQSLLNTLRVDPGIRPKSVLLAEVDLDLARRAYSGSRQDITFQILEQSRTLPWIRSAGAIAELPLRRSGAQMVLLTEGQPEVAPTHLPIIDERVITPGLFETLGMPLRAGRDLTEGDTLQTPLVAVINETAARRYFGQQDPLGRRIVVGHPGFPLARDRARTIVGVVGDVRDYSLNSEARPEVYISYRQRPTNNWGGSEMALPVLFRTTRDLDAVIPSLRKAIESSTPGQPIIRKFQPLQGVLSQSADEQRFRTVLMASFGGTALLLALVGIYGVFGCFVAQRTSEIGLRLALGAQRRDVLRLILGHASKLICLGVAIGVASSLALNRGFASQLVNISPNDPVTLVGVSVLLVGAALAACLIPARRAAQIDPMVTLRHE